MPATYHVTIKKDYAEAILADLEKMEAVESSIDEDSDVPLWHIEDVLRRKSRTDKDPSVLVNEEVILKLLKVD